MAKNKKFILITAALLIVAMLAGSYYLQTQKPSQYPRYKTQAEWEQLVIDNQTEFEEVADSFAGNDNEATIELIQYQNGVNQSPCSEKYVADCTPYFIIDAETDLYSEGNIYPDDKYTAFMEKYNISRLQRNETGTIVEFSVLEVGNCGVKHLTIDSEELFYEPLDSEFTSRWVYFCEN